MTIATDPYYKNDRWNADKDPDNKQTYIIDVTDELTKNALNAVSVTAIPYRMTVTKGPTLEINAGKTYVKVQVKGPTAATLTEPDDAHVTLRVVCDGDGDDFDSTVYYNPVNR